MTTQQHNEFQQLLKTWNEHQDLRHQGAPIADLVESRAKLEQVRLKTLATAA